MTAKQKVSLSINTFDVRREDYGFFGPDSVSWRIWTAPTSLIGFQRAVSLEHFDPHLAASVADSQGIYLAPRDRLDRTLSYFLTLAVADGRTAVELSRLLMKVHSNSTGIDPVTGKRYSANNPASQLWIHITGWHSVLKCYEMFGPGPLTKEEDAQFWAECKTAAELQTCKPSDIPANRDEVREYFDQVRPTLCTSERALEGMHYLMHTPLKKGVDLWLFSNLIAPASIATLPQWMRDLGKLDQHKAVDVVVTASMRAAMKPLFAHQSSLGGLLHPLVPKTARILKAHYAAGVPENPVVVTPQEIKDRLDSE